MTLGYALSSEEHQPLDLVRNAARAEESGFDFALISDHFHPWIDRQGQSPFVWNVLGGIAEATERITVGTGVTCPILRIHPAIVAQAAATAAAMLPGRFFLGVGTGENLNEHVLGQRWPSTEVRREMLEEAVEVMRLLWGGDLTSHRGRHYTVENARIYTLPDEPIEVMVAAGGTQAAKLAGRIGDGLIGTSPELETLEAFDTAGGAGKPRYAQVTVCWAERESDARRIALECWPNAALQGPLGQELPLPSHFEGAAGMVTEHSIAEAIVCGPEPGPYAEAINEYIDAGYTHVYLHQVGADQEGFFRFCQAELLPHYSRGAASAGQRIRASTPGV
jgi:G6PDH family F420-dependent oxidoreductase